jgi:hypothetical protein
MAKVYSKISDTVGRKSEDVTNVEEIHINQLKSRREFLVRSIAKKQAEIANIDLDISEFKKVGVEASIEEKI